MRFLFFFDVGITCCAIIVKVTHAFQTRTTQHNSKSICLQAKATSSSIVGASRKKNVSKLKDWCDEEAGIQLANSVEIGTSQITNGLGLLATSNNEARDVVVTVPASLALSVELPSRGPDDSGVLEDLVDDRRAFRSLPWFVQFSLYLLKLDTISPCKRYSQQSETVNLQKWLDNLPRNFLTPIHWNAKERDELQYSHLVQSIERQEIFWKEMYIKLQCCCSGRIDITWKQFLWGCEISRSRAFSGGNTASFNPSIYVFTLFLTLFYVTLQLGTLEQAANGVALVFCSSILNDFVVPKFFKVQKYVICPVIDMANHNSLRPTANVAFEYFTNKYSLSTTSIVPSSSELLISYGARSNDQLLQYYGFIEEDNPHDTYVLPPLRNWDISALEKACGGKPFPPGRLQKLDRAGLLGGDLLNKNGSTMTAEGITGEDEAAGNPEGGVVLSRASGVDPAIVQALRALVSTDEEWEQAGCSVGNFCEEINVENEKKANIAARTAIEMELSSKPTTIEMDRAKLSSKTEILDAEERIAIMFRIEKKKLLKETIYKLQ